VRKKRNRPPLTSAVPNLSGLPLMPHFYAHFVIFIWPVGPSQ
jgi:hypothetical protein